ncbi:MAG: molecular chaperone DnaK, partial [Desulfobacterales bacterium]
KILQRSAVAPDLILYNGGSLKPAEIQARIRMALQNRTASRNSELPKVLENPDLDLAVAFGAAYYGLVKIGAGVRVGSGSPRAYYLGVARHDQGQPKPQEREVMCIVERGLDEGSTIPMEDKAFDVLTNQPVSFDIFSSSYRSGDRSGDLVRVDDSFTALPPLQTVVQYGKKGAQRAIPVKIEAEYTEVGTLALWCRSRISEHRWKLQFQLRETAAPEAADDAQVLELTVVEAARDLMHRVLSGDDKSRVEKIAKKLSRIVDLPRDDWPLGFIRSLADDLLDLTPVRNKGPDFESAWTNLLGFCLRPEIWMTAANLEKLYSKDKVRLGRQLLAEISPKKLKSQHLWALSRLAARELLYGPADRTIPPAEAARWIEQLIGYAWSNPTIAGRTISQIARKTGDRARDLDEETRNRVLEWMAANELPDDLKRRVMEITPPARNDQMAMFGESLPVGIILRA